MAEITNNNVTIQGRLTDDFTLNHIARGEEFYVSEVAVPRLSGVYDIIPIIVSGRLTDISQLKMGDYLEVQGQIRSLRKKELTQFPTYLFAREIKNVNITGSAWKNEVYLSGTLLSKKDLHTTLSGREAINIKMLIGRKYGKADGISCVLWGRNARFANLLNIGDAINIQGRVQSRVIHPATENEDEKRYIEVSVTQIEKSEVDSMDKTPA